MLLLLIQANGAIQLSLALKDQPALPKASSWGSLLRAYELWALDDDDIHRKFCAQLMREIPAGLGGGELRHPHDLYLVVRELAEGQIELLGDMKKKQQTPNQQSRVSQLLGFWETTLPAALDQEFGQIEAPVAPTLRELEGVVEAR